MGLLTNEKEFDLMKKYYKKYYNSYFSKYGVMIDQYIKKYYGKISKNNINVNIQNNNLLKNKRLLHSFDTKTFLYNLIYRRIFIYEFQNMIYKHIKNESELLQCLKNPNNAQTLSYIGSGKYGSVYKLNDKNICIKFINICEILNDLNNLVEIDFQKEVEISKIADKLDVGPKIYDSYVCVNDENSEVYGIIYMEYINGVTLGTYLESKINKKEVKKIRNMLEKKIFTLYKNNIFHFDLNRNNVMIILDSNHKVKDVKIIDYGKALYLTEYVYLRNHNKFNHNIFHFTKRYLFNKLSILIYNKLK